MTLAICLVLVLRNKELGKSDINSLMVFKATESDILVLVVMPFCQIIKKAERCSLCL
jgi:hypothetical protein